MKIAVRQHNIGARPFPKFFNLDEAIANGEQLPAEDFEVTEKLDGSLGKAHVEDANCAYSFALELGTAPNSTTFARNDPFTPPF